MRRLSVYVETSVWSNALVEDAREVKVETEKFLDEARTGKFDLFISEVVIGEFARASDELHGRLRQLVAEFSPAFLELDDESSRLSLKYLKHGIVPVSKVDDARHVAVSVTNELDVLLSWNYRHLVNARRRGLFQHISIMNGYYKPLQIITPPELYQWDLTR